MSDEDMELEDNGEELIEVDPQDVLEQPTTDEEGMVEMLLADDYHKSIPDEELKEASSYPDTPAEIRERKRKPKKKKRVTYNAIRVTMPNRDSEYIDLSIKRAPDGTPLPPESDKPGGAENGDDSPKTSQDSVPANTIPHVGPFDMDDDDEDTDSVKPLGPDDVDGLNEVIEDPLVVPEDPAVTAQANMSRTVAIHKLIGSPVENDKLLNKVKEQKSTASLLQTLMEEIAEEAAFIKAWRNENWDGEKDLSDTTLKRVKMLKNMVETLVEKEKLKKDEAIGKIDFYGESFGRVMKYFLELIQKTFKSVGIPGEFQKIFFVKLAKEFDGFEKKVEKIYYGKSK